MSNIAALVSPFADMEKQGESFEFFGDPEATEAISAGEAERRRANGEPTFHKRSTVIEGMMI